MTDAHKLFEVEIKKARYKTLKKEKEYLDAKIRLNMLQLQYFELQMRSKKVKL